MNQNSIVNKEYYDLNKDILECSLHLDMLVNPVQCQNASCGEIYCKRCVDELPKSPDNSLKCPNCQQSSTFTTNGTKTVQRMLDNLSLTCVKCTETHSQSAAAKCTRKYCETCAIFYNEKRPHYCFKCWRCSEPFASVEQLSHHVKECDPNPDRNLNKQFKNSISEMWDAINRINRKVSFVFDSIWTLLENKNLTEGFESYNYESNRDKLSHFSNAIGHKPDNGEAMRSEFIAELDLRVFYRDDKIDLFDCQHCQKIGEVDIDRRLESIGQSPRSLIDQYIYMKNKQANRGDEEGEERDLTSWTMRMLQLVANSPSHLRARTSSQKLRNQSVGSRNSSNSRRKHNEDIWRR